jgi:hypothetical protein
MKAKYCVKYYVTKYDAIPSQFKSLVFECLLKDFSSSYCLISSFDIETNIKAEKYTVWHETEE